MTRLGASLAFVTISILISAIKHFVFPTGNASSNEQSQIQMKKLYTITNKKGQEQSKSYGSFYEAYHKLHISDFQQHKYLAEEENFMSQYNSLVLRKSIINDQYVIVCQQNYLITVSQGISHLKKQNSGKQTREWQTQFRVYQLPLLREQTSQVINIQGRVGITKDNNKVKTIKKGLQCRKVRNSEKYSITFPLTNKSPSQSHYVWTLNNIFIKKNRHFIDPLSKSHNSYMERKGQSKKSPKSVQRKNSQNKKVQAQRYEFPKINNNVPNCPFQIQHVSYKLKQNTHLPAVYFYDGNCVTYCTEDEPWVVRYKLGNYWRELDILQKQVQDKVYENLILPSRLPPYERNQKIDINFIFSFQTVEKSYLDNCLFKGRDECTQKQSQKIKNYITVVYLHSNTAYRVQKLYVQLTFQISNKSTEFEQNEGAQFDSPYSEPGKLISYALLMSELNPTQKISIDCSIKRKKQNIFQRYFDKYYWLYEDKLIASLDSHSLLCVFTFYLDENLRVVQIKDLIYSTQINKPKQIAYLDWKSLKKLVNYKEEFQVQTLHRKLQIGQMKPNNTRNETYSNAHQKSIPSSNIQFKTKKSVNVQDAIISYIDLLSEEYQQIIQSEDNQEKWEKKKNRKNMKKATSLGKKKLQKKKQNYKETKNYNKKKKEKKKKLHELRGKMTLSQGQHRPVLSDSYNYSIYRQTVFPHRAQANKYKFPLPFLLSFTKSMQIVDSDTSKPLILFNGIKQYLFTYKLGNFEQNTTSKSKVVDYRYLILGCESAQSKSKMMQSNQGLPQNDIKTTKEVIKQIQNQGLNQKLTIQIKDQTHPQVQNVIKTMFDGDQHILNQIKSIKSVSIKDEFKNNQANDQQGGIQVYQRYLIVVWGWGIEVYQVDWDRNNIRRQDLSQKEIQYQLSRKSGNLVQYFLPFIELFATFYCMFQALVSSR